MKDNLRSSIQFVVNKYGCPEIIAEIGVRSGDNAFNMLSEYPIKHMILVDPYISYDDAGNLISEEAQNRFLCLTLQKMRSMFHRISFMLMSSVQASELIPDDFLDYVYIDADHSYEYVKEDIEKWYPKTSFLAGHDYGGSHKGVTQAVNEFAEIDNKTVIKFPDRDWLIIRYENYFHTR